MKVRIKFRKYGALRFIGHLDVMRFFQKAMRRAEIQMCIRDRNKAQQPDGTLCFTGNGNPKDYGAFGCIITSLREKVWFMEYVTKWVWYNSDDGENEEDFAVEDVLYHYTKRLSVA